MTARRPTAARLQRTARNPGPGPLRTVALLAALTTAACGETGFEVGRPLDIRLDVQNAQRTLGSPHNFNVEVQGRRLVGIVIEFGDGRTDSIPTFGAQSATTSPSHTYESPGTYLVRASAEDMHEGIRRDSVTVEVTPDP